MNEYHRKSPSFLPSANSSSIVQYSVVSRNFVTPVYMPVFKISALTPAHTPPCELDAESLHLIIWFEWQ